jgi:hypothetical protein
MLLRLGSSDCGPSCSLQHHTGNLRVIAFAAEKGGGLLSPILREWCGPRNVLNSRPKAISQGHLAHPKLSTLLSPPRLIEIRITMCKYGVITVASNDCYADPTHVWYKYTVILCNDEGQKCEDAQQDESHTEPGAENNYAVGSRKLGPCYTCVNLAIARKAREEALAEAEEIKRKAEEAYAVAADQAYTEVIEV